MEQLTSEELYQIDGGGWLDDLVDLAKKASSTPLGKVIGVVTLVEPLYDIGVGIKKGWNSYK